MVVRKQVSMNKDLTYFEKMTVAIEADDFDELSDMYVDAVFARNTHDESFAGSIAKEYMHCGFDNMSNIGTYKDSALRIKTCLETVNNFTTGANVSDKEVIEALNTIYKHGTGHFSNNPVFAAYDEEDDDEVNYHHIFEENLLASTVSEIEEIGEMYLKSFKRAAS